MERTDMTSSNNVQTTHIGANLREIHAAMLEIVSMMNRPQQDDALLGEAGVKLDRALFPLLVGIERFGPIGVVDLADRAGRDYTTVSRQVAKLEELGLVHRSAGREDKRVREAVVTTAGKAVTEKIDAARERMGLEVFGSWEPGEIADLARLLTKFVATINTAEPAPTSPEPEQSRHSP
jgi:DNA-binding MarR family transcriptional regulator